jgi:hypothetical protein
VFNTGSSNSEWWWRWYTHIYTHIHIRWQRGRRKCDSTNSQPGIRKIFVVSSTFRPLRPRERAGNHCTGECVGLGTSLNVTENLSFTGIRSTDRPARSETLHRLCYTVLPKTTIFLKDNFLLSLPIKKSVGFSEFPFNISLPESSRFRVVNTNIISTSDPSKLS